MAMHLALFGNEDLFNALADVWYLSELMFFEHLQLDPNYFLTNSHGQTALHV
jgi:hypothetical protein